nr:ribonuclease H-like domain-containing protein [Tanacetum cinerariifolium]
MKGNKCYLTDFEAYDGGFVSFGDGKGRIFGKGKIRIGKLDFDDVYYCKELKYNLFRIENQLDYKVKVIGCDNGTEFKNSVMNQFCEDKGIKREFSVSRTPQQNGVAERRNRTLMEAARTMLVDSKLPTTFWAEAVRTACYVLNRALVTKPHIKTPYELIRGRPPLTDFMKPFGCLVTILNTRDNLGKFEGKANEEYFVGYSVVSKAMRVFNKRTMIVEETLNIRFEENAPNVKENSPYWLFDIDSLTIYMNYVPVFAGNQTNGIAGSKENLVTVKQKSDGIFISQDKYVVEVLKKFDFINVKTSSTPMESNKPLIKDEEAEDVDVHLYRSMIGSLMYLTASRPDITFSVCACARFQVNPKTSHLYAVKRIFKYLKGQPKLGLWYPKDLPFNLEAYSDSDYAGASLDRKSRTEGC